MEEKEFYGFAADPRSVVIDQQPQKDDPPNRAAEPAPPETKDLAVAISPNEPQHRNRPKPEGPALRVPPSVERHSRKCQICRHPDRESIEEDFIVWSTPRSLSVAYGIPEMALYRHAHAVGLFGLRRESMRLSLDRVLERGPGAPVTGDMIIRAVKAQACLTDDNHWVEPAKHVIFSTNATSEREALHRRADSPAASTRILDAAGAAPTQGANWPPITSH